MDWIRHTTKPYESGSVMEVVASGTVVSDGSEQVILERNSLFKLSGYVDLSKMAAGDQVLMRQYMVVLPGSPYKKYAEQPYVDAQDPPLQYVTTKVVAHAVKVTIQQTVGAPKSFDYCFVEEG